MNRRVSKNSVVLCVFSVVLCVISCITEFHGAGPEFHREKKIQFFDFLDTLLKKLKYDFESRPE